MLKQTYAYDDVTLIPQYSELKSRSQANPKMKEYYLPIIASCMDTLGKETMKEIISSNIPFIANRAFKTPKEQFNYFLEDYIKDANSISFKVNDINVLKNVWFAVGSVQKYKDWIDCLFYLGIRRFCVDMAHGDSKACIDTIKYIKSLNSNVGKYTIYGHNDILSIPHVIAGNVATGEGFRRLEKAGADGIRIGVASGSICFSPNTKVMFVSNSGKIFQKEIQYIKKDDKVLTASGKIRKVINTFINDYNGEMYKIDDILATPNHKFHVFNSETRQKEFIQIRNIDMNIHSFIDVEGKTNKVNIDLEEYSGKVFNIEVDDEHTYIVGNKCLGVSNCSTALNTGFGVPILTNIIDCYNARKNKNTWIIADGGVKYTGDIAKAVYFGADFCMMGKMLASTDTALGKCYNKDGQLISINTVNPPAPGEFTFNRPIYPEEFDEIYKLAEQFDKNKISNLLEKIKNNLVAYKEYHGMASRDARKNLLSYASVEGRSGIIEYSKTTKQFIYDTYLNLQASLSYGGSKDWNEFRKKVEACFRSNAGIIAAQTHLDKTFDK